MATGVFEPTLIIFLRFVTNVRVCITGNVKYSSVTQTETVSNWLTRPLREI